MLRHLMNAVKRRHQSPPPSHIEFDAPLRPEHKIYAIGDIHGRADLLDRLLALISRDITEHDAENVQLVFLGDYVDRGDQTAQVLERLQDIATSMTTTCLMGNHEQMMLDFLEAPETRGAMWLRNGGIQTLASYHIGPISAQAKPDQLVNARDALRQALPEGTEKWLRDLPRSWQSGNIMCAHAGMDPNRAVQDQNPQNCIWGHRDFLRIPRQDGNWVVYGHIIIEQAQARDGRISIDTGAYYSGRLSAAVIETEKLRFLST